MDRPLRLISANPVDALARTVEALLVVASQPLTLDELAEATADDTERIETALGLLARALHARAAAASSCRRWPAATRSAPPARPPRRARACSSGRSSAGCRRLLSRRWRSSRTSARSRGPRSPRISGVAADSAVASLVERGLIAEAGRESGPGGAVRYRVTALFERVFGLESLAALPRLDDIGEDQAAIRERLLEVAEARAS